MTMISCVLGTGADGSNGHPRARALLPYLICVSTLIPYLKRASDHE
jgi:hypothetical protein